MSPKILLVDDEFEICRSLRRLLRRANFSVTFTTSPRQASEMLTREHFDVLISDYRMPEMLGNELLAHAQRVSPRTVRLMLSACAEIDTLAAAYDETQILRFIRKPWSDNDFAANLLALLVDKGATPATAQLTVAAVEAAQSRVW